ncbi:MAG: chemotaxis protein CheW [Pseudomonadota bacterium]
MTDAAAPEAELLTFRLGHQEYALDIMCVREIRGWTRATPLPHAPPHMKGVINLRGTVLPVMDLSLRLGLDGPTKTERAVIVVVKHQGAMTGLLVDAVSDIVTVGAEELQTPPGAVGAGGTHIVTALTLLEDRMIRILDLGAIVAGADREVA